MKLWEKSIASLFAGFVGSIVGNPADLSLVRLQVDSSLPVDKRRNYKNVGDALMRTVKEEGILALWRGSTPTVIRAMAMNLGMLASYEQIKEEINNFTGTKNT